MKQVLLGFVLALLWAAITANFAFPNLVLGTIIALTALALLRRSFAQPVQFRRLRRIISLAAAFLAELLLSAFRVAKIVITPDLGSVLRPAIIAFPLSLRTDGEIATLANLITLTPGTLSIDVAPDRSVLYVHVLRFTTREQFIAEVRDGFERQVREAFA